MSESDKQSADQPHRHRGNWDRISIASFVAGASFGIATICNRIRERFFHSFVLNHEESRSPFSTILEEYNGTHKATASGNKKIPGLFDELAGQYNNKKITADEYVTKRKDYAKGLRTEINAVLEKDFKIPTSNFFKDATIGNWKRWQHLGSGAKSESALGFAAVTAVAVGAVAVLRHSKRTLDSIEDRLSTAQTSR